MLHNLHVDHMSSQETIGGTRIDAVGYAALYRANADLMRGTGCHNALSVGYRAAQHRLEAAKRSRHALLPSQGVHVCCLEVRARHDTAGSAKDARHL